MGMRFGAFISPYHAPGQNPNLALHRDLELVEYLDQLGFDEAWIGEHHSGGFELVGSPEVFIAAAAERTHRIKLGTGVVSVPYHHPLILADRMVLLDHLTRGRIMFGMGPGALITDARMMGIDPMDQRRRLEEGLEAICHLLRNDEPLTMETDWFTLRDARLQLRPYSDPCFDLAVAAVRSPTGPVLAGKFNTGLLGISATDPDGGFDYLKETWAVVEGSAAKFGNNVDRKSWRVLAPIHLAKTADQAIENVRHGLAQWLRFSSTGPFRNPGAPDIEETLATTSHEQLCHDMVGSGFAVIGTTEMARTQVQRLWDQTGGFGTFLIFLSEIADPEATRRSLELFAREVMPAFQGQLERPQWSWDNLYGDRAKIGETFRKAQDQMIALHARNARKA